MLELINLVKGDAIRRWESDIRRLRDGDNFELGLMKKIRV